MALGDVFGLDRVYENQLQNYTNYSSETISSYGYVERSDAGTTKASRVDYQTDTTNTPGAGLKGPSRVSSATVQSPVGYVYFGGGYLPSGVAPQSSNSKVIHKSDIDTETFIGAIPGAIGQAKYILEGAFNPSYGYFVQGNNQIAPTNFSSTVDKLDFSNDTAAPAGNMTYADQAITSLQNNTYFWTIGGYNTPTNTAVSRFTFSDDTTSARPTWTPARHGMCAIDSPQYGYLMGGIQPPYPTASTTIYRWDYSAETGTEIPANTANPSAQAGLPVSGTSHGYFSANNGTNLQKFNTDTGTVFNLGSFDGAPLSNISKQTWTGGSKITRGTPNFENWNESATYGYVMLGTEGPTGADSSSVLRIDHSNETTSLPTAKQTVTARGKNSRMQDNQYGFDFGGQGIPPTTYFSQFDRLDFLSETLSRLTNIPVADNSIASIDNDDIGYFIGGSSSTSPVPSSNYHRFDFKTDNVSYSKPSAVFNYIGSRGSLTFEDPSLRYGYVQGSYRPGTPQSLVARMEFSTETEVLSTPLLDKLAYGATAASKYHGYVMSGLNSPSSNTTYTRKFEWATETYGTIADTITEKRRLHSASHTGDSAWVMGGYKDNSPAGYTCTIERIDFETDTYSSPGNNFSVYLSQGSSHRGGSSLRQVGRNNRNDSRAGLDNQGRQVSSAMGYIVGGYVSLARSYVERLDMLNETISDPGTRLTHGKYLCKGINSRNYGYYMNAGSPNSAPEGGPGSNTSVVDKLDFSNETQDSFLSGVFGPNSASGAWTYDTNYGYGSVGQDTTLTPNYDTKLYRMDFETDGFSARQSTWVTGTNGKTRTATIQNNNFTTGYFIGEQPAKSNCEKLDFLTETLTQIQDYPEIVNMGAGTVRAPDAAYIAGGGAPNRTSNVYRLEYSTETFSAPGAQKAGGYDGSAGTFNENYGYFSKGYEPVGSYTSNTERMEFTNDTLLTVPSGKTSVLSSYGVGATQNAQ